MAEQAKSDRLRVGLVGAGGMARTHTRSWMELKDIAEVIAVCDLDRAKADERAREFALPAAVYDLADLLAMRPDIVDVVLPNSAHRDVTVACLQAGCHVLCEKPLAVTPGQVESMVAAAEQSGRLLMAAQNQRFVPGHQALRRLIAAGELGEIYYVHTQWLRRRFVPSRASYYSKASSGGGPIIDLAVHALDLMMWLADNFEPVSVSGSAVQKLAHRRDGQGPAPNWDPERFDVEDFGAAMVRFANGAVMNVEVSWLSHIIEPEMQRATILGTEGGATLPDLKIAGARHGVQIDSQFVHPPQVSSYVEELRAFCDAVRRGGPSPVPPTQSLAVARILDAWYRSSESGGEVRLAAP